MSSIFYNNIEEITINETNFRRVLFTTLSKKLQLVTMSLKPKEDIGMEMHPDVDQFIRVEAGIGYVAIGKENPKIKPLYDGMAIVIPRGTWHNIVNTSGRNTFKLYSIYTPANHPEGTLQRDKPQEHEHFCAGTCSNNNLLIILIIAFFIFFYFYKNNRSG